MISIEFVTICERAVILSMKLGFDVNETRNAVNKNWLEMT